MICYDPDPREHHWTEEPECERMTGWQRVGIWAVCFAGSWLLLGALVYAALAAWRAI